VSAVHEHAEEGLCRRLKAWKLGFGMAAMINLCPGFRARLSVCMFLKENPIAGIRTNRKSNKNICKRNQQSTFERNAVENIILVSITFSDFCTFHCRGKQRRILSRVSIL
jgi:hypothetical protein